MNHGYCINCWWYQATKNRSWIVTSKGLVEKLGEGNCWARNGDEHPYQTVAGDCYCPEYWNRKQGDKENGSLQNWIDNMPKLWK